MNLNLIGMRGVGKSNISRRLSVMTKLSVLSTDVLIEYENGGRSIPDLVADHGWPAFREREYEVVRKVATMDRVIVDCGGGVVVDLADDGEEIYSERKITLLKQQGPVIWLMGDIARLAAKSAGSATRPQLDERRSTAEIMTRRLPFYERAADLTLDVEGRSRAAVAEELCRRFRHELAGPSH